MNYELMSDFEINKAAFILAIKLGLADCEDLMQKKYPNKDSVMYADGANWHEWDGCNNPSDAWPIIIENKISILSDCVDGYVAVQDLCLGNDYTFSHYAENKKPLRAAMIVFLMMQGD